MTRRLAIEISDTGVGMSKNTSSPRSSANHGRKRILSPLAAVSGDLRQPGFITLTRRRSVGPPRV